MLFISEKYMRREYEMNPVVSVIIPVYNTDINMLKQCITSVVEQSFRSLEIVVIDDCSTKSDVLIYLDSLHLASSKINIFHAEQNRGIACSRNKGIELASGEWICFLDHDDWWERGYLETLLSVAESTDLVQSGYQVVDEDGKILQAVPDIGNEEFVNSSIFFYSTAAPWNRLIRREFLLQNNIRFPEGCLTEDITFNITCNYYANNPKGIACRGYCNYLNRDSTSRSRTFAAMPYDRMPFQDIEKNCILGRSLQGGSGRKIHEAAIGNQLTLLVCVFSRRSCQSTKSKAQKKAAYLIRHYMSGYVGNACMYNKHIQNRPAMKMIYFGYMLAICLYLDKFYCAAIHAVLKVVLDSGIKAV